MFYGNGFCGFMGIWKTFKPFFLSDDLSRTNYFSLLYFIKCSVQVLRDNHMNGCPVSQYMWHVKEPFKMTEDDNAVIILCARCLGNNIENDSTPSCKNSLMI